MLHIPVDMIHSEWSTCSVWDEGRPTKSTTKNDCILFEPLRPKWYLLRIHLAEETYIATPCCSRQRFLSFELGGVTWPHELKLKWKARLIKGILCRFKFSGCEQRKTIDSLLTPIQSDPELWNAVMSWREMKRYEKVDWLWKTFWWPKTGLRSGKLLLKNSLMSL